MLDQIYKKDPNVVARRIADEVILVPIKRRLGEVHAIYTLNNVGGRIWELLDGHRSVGQVRDDLVEEFEVTPDQAEADLIQLFEHFQTIGAVQEVATVG